MKHHIHSTISGCRVGREKTPEWFVNKVGQNRLGDVLSYCFSLSYKIDSVSTLLCKPFATYDHLGGDCF